MDALFACVSWLGRLTVMMMIVTLLNSWRTMYPAAKEEAAKKLKAARGRARERALDDEEKALLDNIQRVGYEVLMCALGAKCVSPKCSVSSSFPATVSAKELFCHHVLLLGQSGRWKVPKLFFRA